MVKDTDSPETRQREFHEWVRTVRDSAEESAEGMRTLATRSGGAIAEYNVAPISEQRWAILINISYRCGDCRGVGIPWTTFSSREECIRAFLKKARRHFGRRQGRFESDAQRIAQMEMADLLDEGLFGFSEPAPSVRV